MSHFTVSSGPQVADVAGHQAGHAPPGREQVGAVARQAGDDVALGEDACRRAGRRR
jgi:hypothetical protein